MSTTRSNVTRMTAAAGRHPARTVVAALALVATAGAGAVTGGGGPAAPATTPGPTTTASTRDLVTTLQTTGIVERAEQRIISYTGAATTVDPVASAPPPATPAAVAPAAAPPAATPPATAPPATATTATPTQTSPEVAEPDVTAAAPASCPPGDDTTTTTVCLPGDPAPITTAVPSPGTTTSPAQSAVTPTVPPPATTATAAQPAAPTTGSGRPDTTTAAAVGGRSGAAPSGATATAMVVEEDPAVLTAVAAVGSEVERGTVLYAAEDEPVVALAGPVPAWRTLEPGVDAGADVRQLEENLTALGFGAGVSVDDEFTSATAAAVKQWEAALGRADPDGVVDLGDVVFLPLPGTILAHEAGVGDPLEAGTPILLLGSRQQLVRATVAAGEAASWAAGSAVALAWSDATSSTGNVSGTGHDVTDGRVELVIVLTDADNARPSGAQVTITSVDARRDGVVAVPVAAVVEGPSGDAAVRRASTVAGAADRLVTVTTGIVAGGWIEIRSGIAVGDPVRLPG